MSTTNDSEAWLDRLFKNHTSVIGLDNDGDGEPDLWQISNWYGFKQQILAHYAYYLKPKDVERAVFEARLDELQQADNDLGVVIDKYYLKARIASLEAQLSKLNREEEKDA